MSNTVNKNDKVSGKKYVYDTWYTMRGNIVDMQKDSSGEVLVKIDNGTDTDWYPIGDVTVVETRLSRQYNTTPSRINEENINFLQSEGWYETAKGMVECHTFRQWLDLVFAKPKFKITEPWQKGDLGYGL